MDSVEDTGVNDIKLQEFNRPSSDEALSDSENKKKEYDE